MATINKELKTKIWSLSDTGKLKIIFRKLNNLPTSHITYNNKGMQYDS